MDYDTFLAHGERCKKVWADFKQSFDDPGLKEYLKKSYPVLNCSTGQIPLDSLDANSIAATSPGSFVPTKASKSLIEHVRCLEHLKKETEISRKTERRRVEKWLKEFDRQKLEFREHRLEVRFQSLKIDLVQEIKRSPFVDPDLTSMGLASIRIVLRVPTAATQ